MSNVSITLHNNDEARGLIAAIEHDNPNATVHVYPGMVKIDCPKKLIIKRDSVSERIGREWDVQELHLTVISLAGNIDEDDEYFVLEWQHA